MTYNTVRAGNILCRGFPCSYTASYTLHRNSILFHFIQGKVSVDSFLWMNHSNLSRVVA